MLHVNYLFSLSYRSIQDGSCQTASQRIQAWISSLCFLPRDVLLQSNQGAVSWGWLSSRTADSQAVLMGREWQHSQPGIPTKGMTSVWGRHWICWAALIFLTLTSVCCSSRGTESFSNLMQTSELCFLLTIWRKYQLTSEL